MTTHPEFSRAYRLDTLGSDARTVDVVANDAERDALAKRFGLIALNTLSATATLTATSNGIELAGKMRARAEQACVVTGDPVPVTLEERFSVRFIAPDAPVAGNEIELNIAEPDIIEHDGNVVDVGEAVAQTLGLAFDPFPRGPRADSHLKTAGVISEDASGPFGALKALKDVMKKDGS